MEGEDVLRRYVSFRSRFFALKDGEEKKIEYLGAEEIPNHFDGGKSNCIRYRVKEDGVEKYWDRVSRELAEQMSSVGPTAVILIKRIGAKSKTKYFIRKAE